MPQTAVSARILMREPGDGTRSAGRKRPAHPNHSVAPLLTPDAPYFASTGRVRKVESRCNAPDPRNNGDSFHVKRGASKFSASRGAGCGVSHETSSPSATTDARRPESQPPRPLLGSPLQDSPLPGPHLPGPHLQGSPLRSASSGSASPRIAPPEFSDPTLRLSGPCRSGCRRLRRGRRLVERCRGRVAVR